MKQKLLIISIILLVMGNIGRIYANNYSHVDANGILRDTAWMPVSALMLLIGIFLLLISIALFGYGYIKNH